jgi:DNA replication protein DnaC
MAIVACPCECRVIRKSLRNIAESGLSEQLERFTLETFRTETPLQEEVKTKAQAFLAAPTGRWFYAGGQVGCGKTHICTAITGELLKQGKSARYMLWRDDSVKIKACVNDAAEYNALVEPLKNVDVLYIDDFLKTGGNNPPTTADVNLAFEIINHRILYERKITVISSEYSLDKILEIDEALGSRIYQRAKEFSVYIGKGACKNWRLR